MSDTKRDARTIAAEVAPHLPGWTVVALPAHEDDPLARRTWARFEGPAGAGLSIYFPPFQRGQERVHLHGVFPKNAKGYTFGRSDPSPRISVRADRGGEAIAGEITRRLLPIYLSLYTDARLAYLDDQRRGEDAEALAKQLAERVDLPASVAQLRRADDSFSIYPEGRHSVKITVQPTLGAEAQFELSLPGPLALELADWIAAHLQVERAPEGDPRDAEERAALAGAAVEADTHSSDREPLR